MKRKVKEYKSCEMNLHLDFVVKENETIEQAKARMQKLANDIINAYGSTEGFGVGYCLPYIQLHGQ